VSQPTMSQQIGQLDRTLIAQPLERSGRITWLTDSGAYLRYARRPLEDLNTRKRCDSRRAGVEPWVAVYGDDADAHYLPDQTVDVQQTLSRHHAEHSGDVLGTIEALLDEDELNVRTEFENAHSPDIAMEVLLVEAPTGGRIAGKWSRFSTISRN
jgi:LysR family transcriptional regulator, cyn operon transcriptional activator